MSIKTTVIAVILAAAPAFSYAMCTGHTEQTAASCAEGQVWDADAQACVDRVGS